MNLRAHTSKAPRQWALTVLDALNQLRSDGRTPCTRRSARPAAGAHGRAQIFRPGGGLAPIGARALLTRFLDVELEYLTRFLNTDVMIRVGRLRVVGSPKTCDPCGVAAGSQQNCRT